MLGVGIKHPEKGKLLDATVQEFREALYSAMLAKQCSEDDLPEVTAVLIEEMEAENGKDFDVVKLFIKTPPKLKGVAQSVAQMVSRVSDAYLVKENGLHLINEIRIMK